MSAELSYEDFLKRKKHSENYYGFDAVYKSNYLFDYQNYIVEISVKKGRMAIFADTGLGKTAIELAIAHNIVLKTNKRVVILTPLAVAYQFVVEAEKMSIPDVYHSKKGELNGKIIICNYERLHYLNANDYVCVICDESSILKNFEGTIKNNITTFMKKIDYRYLATATPSPNDYIELGTSSEALGYLGYTDMLNKYFTNNERTIKSRNFAGKFTLKPHAITNFFEWIKTWGIAITKPSDIGFSDNRHVMPNLIKNYHSVKNNKPIITGNQYNLFNITAKNNYEIRNELQSTLQDRCEKAVELSNNYDSSVYWCNYNSESELLNKLDSNAIELKGGMDLEKKEDILINFQQGNIKKLITKAKITAFGLNWQHCNHTVYFPNWSYEQYYQAIRRLWRYGQKNDVICDIVYSDGQNRVLEVLENKTNNAKYMFEHLTKNTNYKQDAIQKKQFNDFNLPNFLKG